MWPCNNIFLNQCVCFTNPCFPLPSELYFQNPLRILQCVLLNISIGPQCQWNRVSVRLSVHAASDLFSFISPNSLFIPMMPTSLLALFKALLFSWIFVEAVTVFWNTTYLITWWNSFNYSKPNPKTQTRHPFCEITQHFFLWFFELDVLYFRTLCHYTLPLFLFGLLPSSVSVVLCQPTVFLLLSNLKDKKVNLFLCV